MEKVPGIENPIDNISESKKECSEDLKEFFGKLTEEMQEKKLSLTMRFGTRRDIAAEEYADEMKGKESSFIPDINHEEKKEQGEQKEVEDITIHSVSFMPLEEALKLKNHEAGRWDYVVIAPEDVYDGRLEEIVRYQDHHGHLTSLYKGVILPSSEIREL